MRGDEAASVRFREDDARARSMRCGRCRSRPSPGSTGLATAPASRSPWPATSASPGADARFAITPAKIGISYPQEDVHRLVALVGPGQAARLLFTADEHRCAPRRCGSASSSSPSSTKASAILANDADSLAALKRGDRARRRGRAQRSGAGPALRRADRRRRAGAPARSAAAEMIGRRMRRLALSPSPRLLRRRAGSTAADAADDRIECQAEGEAALRAQLHGRDGRHRGRPHAHHPQGRRRLPAAARHHRRQRRRRRRRRRAHPCDDPSATTGSRSRSAATASACRRGRAR